METITAKKKDMRFDECYIKDVEENLTEFCPRLNLPASHLCDVIKFREFIY